MILATTEKPYLRSMPVQRPGDGYPLILSLLGQRWVVVDHAEGYVTLRAAEVVDYRPTGMDPARAARMAC